MRGLSVPARSSVISHMQRLAELLREGKLSLDKSTGLLRPTGTDVCLPAHDRTGETPTSPFSNYLHSHHEPVSALTYLWSYMHCLFIPS